MSQKQRDGVVDVDKSGYLTPSKRDLPDAKQKVRSIFYALILRTVSNVIKDKDSFSDEQLMRFLRTTSSDLAEELESEHKLPADMVSTHMKAKCIQIIFKQVLTSIMMTVMSKKSGELVMTAKQEETCYCQFVEDYLNMVFSKGEDESYPNLMLVSSLPTLMHGSFVNKDMQAKILEKVKGILEELEISSSELKAYCLKVVTDHITKLTAAPKEKKPTETKAVKKSVKDTIGRKRVYAER